MLIDAKQSTSPQLQEHPVGIIGLLLRLELKSYMILYYYLYCISISGETSGHRQKKPLWYNSGRNHAYINRFLFYSKNVDAIPSNIEREACEMCSMEPTTRLEGDRCGYPTREKWEEDDH